MTCKHDWLTLNGRNGWARCSNCGDETSWQNLLLMMSEGYEERIEKLKTSLAYEKKIPDDAYLKEVCELPEEWSFCERTFAKELLKARERLEKAERLGAQMASALYNVRQEGWKILPRDREVMGELVEKWDNRNKS